MPQPKDLTGEKFGKLTVTRFLGSSPRRWVCVCDCGKETITRSKNLLCGVSRSCGCARLEKAQQNGLKKCQKIWPKTCRHCETKFLGTAKQKYCSRECKEKSVLVGRSTVNCKQCNKKINARKGQRFCSDRCKCLSQKLERRKKIGCSQKCKNCGKKFTAQSGPEKYCSKECKTVSASKIAYEKRNPSITLAKLNGELNERN